MLKLHLWHEANIEKYKNETNRVELFQVSEDKLKKYLFDDGMPSMELLKAARFLDPKQFKNLNNELKSYVEFFPKLKNANAEWLQYINIVNESNFSTVFDINEFWISKKKSCRNYLKYHNGFFITRLIQPIVKDPFLLITVF